MKEELMARRKARYFTVSNVLLALVSTATLNWAQLGPVAKLPVKRRAASVAHTANHHIQTPGSPSYSYTLLNFPWP